MKFLITTILLLLCIYSVHSQELQDRMIIGIHGGVAVPTGDYNLDYNTIGGSLSVQFQYNISKFIGLQASYRFAAITNEKDAFEKLIWNRRADFTELPNSQFRIITFGPSIGLHNHDISISFQPQIGIIKESDLDINTQIGNTVLYSFNTADAGVAYGAGLQLKFGLSKLISLGLNANYLRSQYDYTSVTQGVESGITTFQMSLPQEANTDFIFIDVGLYFNL